MRSRRGNAGSSRSRPRNPGPLRAPLVLIVDDNAEEREMYSAYLSSQGFRLIVAGDGVTAVDVAEAMQPDVIVMDLSLPRLDGWEATRRLKRNPATAHIPVLACTGHALGAAVEQAIDAGCDGYVVKPCAPADLLREIRRLLGRFGRQRQA